MLTAMMVLAAVSFGAADDKEAAEAIDRFKQSYKAPSGPARATAVAELAKVPHEKTFKTLVPMLYTDVVVVRVAAAKGMAAFTDYKKLALPALLGALGTNEKEPDVLEALFFSIGKLGDESTVPTVHKYVENKDPKAAKAALGAAGDIKSTSSIEFILDYAKKMEKMIGEPGGGGGPGQPAIPGGGDDPQRVRAQQMLPACIKALQAITQEKWATLKEWQIWWSRKKGSFSPAR